MQVLVPNCAYSKLEGVEARWSQVKGHVYVCYAFSQHFIFVSKEQLLYFKLMLLYYFSICDGFLISKYLWRMKNLEEFCS